MVIKKKRKLFVDDDRWHGTVILNWHNTPEKEFTYIAEAFRVLAQEEVKRQKKNKQLGRIPIEDFRAYPIVFLYRHALELYMKSIILIGSDMLRLNDQPVFERENVFTTHNLDVLRQEVERVFTVYGWGWDLGNSNFGSVKDFRKIVGELHAIDAGSYSFRYPVDTKGKPSLEADFRFNLFKFASILDDLFPTLEGAAIGAHEVYQDKLRELGEAQEYERQNRDYQYEYDYYEPDDYEPPYHDSPDE